MKKAFLCLLALALTLSLAACGEKKEEAPPAEEPTELVLENGGLKLTVPAEYADLLIAQTPENDEEGVLFAFSEKESVEAGKKLSHDEEWGDGWLFSIGRIPLTKLQELLAYD
ncbi:MAG: hypothetical protein IKN53_05855, partial [Oscillibacter sp.]|nr:hypothetical protein [Oscillibacter sp.]